MRCSVQRPEHPDALSFALELITHHAGIILQLPEKARRTQFLGGKAISLKGWERRLVAGVKQTGGAPTEETVPYVGAQAFGKSSNVGLGEIVGLGVGKFVGLGRLFLSTSATKQGGFCIHQELIRPPILSQQISEIRHLYYQHGAGSIPGALPGRNTILSYLALIEVVGVETHPVKIIASVV